MDVWGWIAIYAVGLTVLQLLVYRYLLNSGGSLTRRVGTPFGERDDGEAPWSNGSRGRTESSASGSGSSGSSSEHDTSGSRDGSPAPSTPRGVGVWPAASADAATEPAPTESDGRACQHCGAVNEFDETFTRCWNCTREL